MPSRNPQFENWRATCKINPQMADEFYKKAQKIANNEFNQLVRILKSENEHELAQQIEDCAQHLVIAATPADKVTDTKAWAESRRKTIELCELLSNNIDELGPLTYRRPGLGDSLFHFMGEFAARERIAVDMDGTYRQFVKDKNSFIDSQKARGHDTDLKKTEEQYSISSRYANRVFMQNVLAVREGYDDKGMLGQGGSTPKHEAFVNSVTELTEASAHIVNAAFGDNNALNRKVKAMKNAKKAAENYIAAKKKEAGIDPDNTEWRPKTPMGRKRYEAALGLIIVIDDETERLNAPETPEPLYDGELPDDPTDTLIEKPFLKYTWVTRLGEIPDSEPQDTAARDALLEEYKCCKLAIDIVNEAKDLPVEEKTPEKFRSMLRDAVNNKDKLAKLDAQLGDDPWANMVSDKNAISRHFYMEEIFEYIAADPTIDARSQLGDEVKKLGDISKDLKDKGLFGKRGSSDKHNLLVTAADDLEKLTDSMSKSKENYEKLREEHLEALKKAKKAAEEYIAEKKKHGWGDTSSPDWRPLSPMGKMRYEAALELLSYADDRLETEMMLADEKTNSSPEAEDAVSERSDSYSDIGSYESNTAELSENELGDMETSTLDNNVKDVESRDEMIEEVGETLEQEVEHEQEVEPDQEEEPEQEKAPEKDDSKIPADLNKDKYLGMLEKAGEKLNSPNANWNDTKMEIMAGTACVLFINQLENAFTKKGQPMPNMSQQTFNELVSDTMSDPAFDRTFEQFGGTSFGALNRVKTSVLKDGGKDFFAKFRKNQMAIENENKMNEKIKEGFQKKNELTKNKNKKLEHTMQ